MHALIARYGLAGVLIGAALEGDGTMLLAGVTVHLGLLRFSAAVAMGTLGAVLADLVCYAIGRNRAGTIHRTRLYSRVGAAVERRVDRIGPWEVVCARFVYGTRVASMLFWGMRGLPLARFVCLDVLGCALWAIALAGLGFSVSGSVELLIGRVRRAERWLLIALLCIALASALARYLLRRHRRALPPPRPPSNPVQ